MRLVDRCRYLNTKYLYCIECKIISISSVFLPVFFFNFYLLQVSFVRFRNTLKHTDVLPRKLSPGDFMWRVWSLISDKHPGPHDSVSRMTWMKSDLAVLWLCLQVVFASARRVESVCLKCVWLIKHFCFLTLEKSCLWMWWTSDTDFTVLPLICSTCEGWCDLYNEKHFKHYMISFHV